LPALECDCIVNDWRDIDVDRFNARRCQRLLAAGAISVRTTPVMMPVLHAATAAIGLFRGERTQYSPARWEASGQSKEAQGCRTKGDQTRHTHDACDTLEAREFG
jgi:hypothetical protein